MHQDNMFQTHIRLILIFINFPNENRAKHDIHIVQVVYVLPLHSIIIIPWWEHWISEEYRF